MIQHRSTFAMHHRIVPMWIAGISAKSIARGRRLVEVMFGVSAGQASFRDVPKTVKSGVGTSRTIPDYDTEVTALGLFATLRKADLPDVDMWFVFAGLEKAFGGKAALPDGWLATNLAHIACS
jgi:hypothetical protein